MQDDRRTNALEFDDVRMENPVANMALSSHVPNTTSAVFLVIAPINRLSTMLLRSATLHSSTMKIPESLFVGNALWSKFIPSLLAGVMSMHSPLMPRLLTAR